MAGWVGKGRSGNGRRRKAAHPERGAPPATSAPGFAARTREPVRRADRRREREQHHPRDVRQDVPRRGLPQPRQALRHHRVRPHRSVSSRLIVEFLWLTYFFAIGLMAMPRTPIAGLGEDDAAEEGVAVDASLLPPG